MKLRNKKTGEIGELYIDYYKNTYTGKQAESFGVQYGENNTVDYYDTLAELNEEWGDYKEPEMVQIHLEKRSVNERLLDLTIKMADVQDDIAILKKRLGYIDKLEGENE